MRVFGIDPGSERTGYGCIETDGSRHRIIACGAVSPPLASSFSDKLFEIHRALLALLTQYQSEAVAIENIFHAVNVRSALKLGHARGVAMLAAAQAGLSVAEYTPTEDQACRRRLRTCGEAPGSAHGEATAWLGGGSIAPRRRRRARGGYLPRAFSDGGSRRGSRRSGPPGGSWDRGKQGDELAPRSPRTAVIAHLLGRLSEKHPNRIVIDVHGVGYDVAVPLSTFYGLGDEGSDVSLARPYPRP